MGKIVNPTIIKDRSVLTGEGAPYRNKNLFIEAGAGAGKTNYIINKIIDELLQGIEPKRFVVITFTNKATEEMLGRIISDITARANDEKLSSNDKKILQNAKDKLFEMNVSTIHSFCNKLLNENSFASKLAFGAELIEEDEEKKRIDNSFFSWQKTLNSTENYELFNKPKESIINKVRNTYEALCNSFDNVEYDDSYSFNFTPLFEACEELYDYIISSQGKPSESTNKFINAYDEFYSMLSEDFVKLIKENDESAIENLKNFTSTIKGTMSVSGVSPSEKEELKELVKKTCEIKKLVDAYLKDRYTPTINKYAIKAWEYYKEHRDRESLSNNQLIYETYKLLQDDNVCNAIAKNYDVIFIDEFQDTDKCQIEFIIKLARAIDKRKQQEGNNTTSLVVVGDPKQSIYRFRGADFESFSKVRNDFSTYGSNFEPIFFPDNFRSNDLVINYVNDIFAKKDLADGYTYNKMEPSLINKVSLDIKASNFLAGVYSYSFLSEGENKFDNLARFIKYLVDTKYQINKKYRKIINNKKVTETKVEPVSYEDFLILTCSHSEMNTYVESLNKLNIPSQIAGEFSLSSSKIMRIIYRIIKYLLDKQENNRILLVNTLKLFVNNPQSSLEKIENETDGMSCYGKLLYILNNLQLIIDEYSETDDYLYHSISQQLLEKICVNDYVSDSELINKLDELLLEPSKSEIALDPSSKAVRLMNVHQSKGLEGHIVIIVDSGGFGQEKPCKLYKSKLFLNNTKINPDLCEKISKETKQERIRLEYVAATRAEQVLIFDKSFKSDRLFNLDKENVYDFSDETLLPYRFLDSSLPSKEEVNEHFNIDDNKLSSGIEVSYLRTNKINKESLDVEYLSTSPSMLENHSDNTEKVIEPRRPYDNIFGTCFHRVMELFVKNENQNIDEIVNKSILENINDIDIACIEKYKLSLKECLLSVKKLFDDNGYLINAKEKKPEFKFIDFDSSIYGNTPTLMSGSIDLLLINKDGSITIFDYKTDIAKFHDVLQFENLLKDTYSNQLQAYKKLVLKLFKTSNVETKIIWMEEDKYSTIAHEIAAK